MPKPPAPPATNTNDEKTPQQNSGSGQKEQGDSNQLENNVDSGTQLQEDNQKEVAQNSSPKNQEVLDKETTDAIGQQQKPSSNQGKQSEA